MTRRAATASFAPGAYVFPGGGIDSADALAHGQSSRRTTQSDLHLTQAIAAIRESFEELGVLLARRADGSHLSTGDIAALDRKAPFADQCAAHGLTLSGAEVFVLAHWLTDRDLPRRFDVPFLVARMPEWKKVKPQAANLQVAVMGCVVNGPGESKAAHIGISLPGTGEAPRTPLYEDGVQVGTLEGPTLAKDFLARIEAYVARME